MRLEDIVSTLNNVIAQTRKDNNIVPKSNESVVLHKTIEINKTFKAYRTYRYTVWVIDGTNKKELLTFSKQVNISEVPQYDRDNFNSKLELSFLQELLQSMLESNSLKDIINGEFICNRSK